MSTAMRYCFWIGIFLCIGLEYYDVSNKNDFQGWIFATIIVWPILFWIVKYITLPEYFLSSKEKKERKEEDERIKQSKNYDIVEKARQDFSQGLIGKEEYLQIMRDNS